MRTSIFIDLDGQLEVFWVEVGVFIREQEAFLVEVLFARWLDVEKELCGLPLVLALVSSSGHMF